MSKLDALQFAVKFRDMADMLKRHGWKVKVTVWNDEGDEWEVTPVGTKQTKKATVVVPCTVETPNAKQTETKGP